MDKEKEIQELERLICPYGYEHFSDSACGECPIRCDGDAKKLYNAGYRKADEVRKETAKEILQEVGEYMSGYIWFKELCDKYGVEVDE